MIKTTVGQLIKPEFMSGCQKVHGCPSLDGLTAYNASKIIRQLNDELVIARDGLKKLAQDFAVLNEQGGFQTTEEYPYFQIKEGMSVEEYKKKVEDFATAEVSIERPQLALANIASVKLSPLEIEAIDCMIRA